MNSPRSRELRLEGAGELVRPEADSPPSDVTPLVSVLLTTYNHEPYIAQALDSVLSQRTDFPFEVIVTEDCSTDATRRILFDYRDQHPERIRLLLSERNLCSNEVLVRAFAAARGRYAALLDGDDYWSSPTKLQKQVERMERDPDCSLCFHDVLEFFEDGSSPPRLRHGGVDPKLTLEGLMVSNLICTASVMLRTEALGTLPEWYSSSVFGDWELFILAGLGGSFAFVNEPLAAYRRHRGGYWSGSEVARQIEGVIRFHDRMIEHLEDPHRETLRRERRKYPVQLAVERAGVPMDGYVLVASGGDYGLLYLNGRYTRHFPGSHDHLHLEVPTSESETAIANLEERRAEGATHLVVPELRFGWLNERPRLLHHLETRCECILDDPACLIYRLQAP